jgi:acetoacetyl-[acyl-carrier protein] synthase
MKKLPVIVGFGGINAAGRSSFHHAYRRMVHEVLPAEASEAMFKGLATLMNQPDNTDTSSLLEQTLIRKIEKQTFDLDEINTHRKASLKPGAGATEFQISKRQLPKNIPENWSLEELEDGSFKVSIKGELEVMLPDKRRLAVSSAGQLPTGFAPEILYNSRNQPKGLQLTVFGASDAIQSIGIDWQEILKHIKPDEVSVYAGSALGQFDDLGARGLSQAWLKGGRVSSKQMPLMLGQMPADFINSYMINSIGATGTNMGACATFLYNLRQGIGDIQSGESRVVIVGSAEAPLEPEVIEGFRAMGALAEDLQLANLDNSETPDLRRACRPFAENAGFTVAEAAQFFVLMDDELALELGATIYASVADVFVNADANKKSISSPGVGNYVTVAKAVSLARQILGKDGAKKTFVQAHGTGTPQNRVSESHILNEVAKAFDIEDWNVAAIKSYVGHSLGPAGGDQLSATLGVWEYGYIPAINTIDKIADDVLDSNLHFCLDHTSAGEKGCDMEAAVINSKGFGGNNATALVLSPLTTMTMLENKHGATRITEHAALNQVVAARAKAYDESMINGDIKVIYNFGSEVMTEEDISLTDKGVKLSGFENKLHFDQYNPYSEYCRD